MIQMTLSQWRYIRHLNIYTIHVEYVTIRNCFRMLKLLEASTKKKLLQFSLIDAFALKKISKKRAAMRRRRQQHHPVENC